MSRLTRRRVRVGAHYRFDPVPFDKFNPPANLPLAPGDIVKVVNMHGAPPANTMGMCYVEKDGVFAGMVMTNSLEPVRRPRRTRDSREPGHFGGWVPR